MWMKKCQNIMNGELKNCIRKSICWTKKWDVLHAASFILFELAWKLAE